MKMRRPRSHWALASEASGGLDRPLRRRIYPLVVVKRTSVEIAALKSNVSNSIARGITTNTLKHSSIRIGHCTWSSKDPGAGGSLTPNLQHIRHPQSYPGNTSISYAFIYGNGRWWTLLALGFAYEFLASVEQLQWNFRWKSRLLEQLQPPQFLFYVGTNQCP